MAWILLTEDRNRAVRAAIGLEAAGRATNLASLLDDAPSDLRPEIRPEILWSADEPLLRF